MPQPEIVELTIGWAYRVPERELPGAFKFNAADSEILTNAARFLREESPNEGLLVTGVVVSLHREEGAKDGSVTVAAVVEGNIRKLAVPLMASDYDAAIQAHRNRQGVIFRADVVKIGKHFRAENVRDFKVTQ